MRYFIVFYEAYSTTKIQHGTLSIETEGNYVNSKDCLSQIKSITQCPAVGIKSIVELNETDYKYFIA